MTTGLNYELTHVKKKKSSRHVTATIDRWKNKTNKRKRDTDPRRTTSFVVLQLFFSISRFYHPARSGIGNDWRGRPVASLQHQSKQSKKKSWKKKKPHITCGEKTWGVSSRISLQCPLPGPLTCLRPRASASALAMAPLWIPLATSSSADEKYKKKKTKKRTAGGGNKDTGKHMV